MAKTTSVKANMARQYLLDCIHSGKFRPGQKLPSERELAKALDMNTLTLRRGLEQLVTEGVVVKQARVGNFVNPDLAKNKAVRIAVCLSESTQEHLPQVSLSQLYTLSLQQNLPRNRYEVVVFYYDNKYFHEQVVERAIDQNCRAIVTRVGGLFSEKDLFRLAKNQIACMSIERPPNHLANRMYWVSQDKNAIWTEMILGLLKRGHSRILIARYTHTSIERIGYKQIQHLFPSEEALEQTVQFVDVPNPRKDADLGLLEKALQNLSPRTALIVPDEMLAASILRYSLRNGIAIPQDYSLATMQNLVPELHSIPLTSLDSKENLARICQHAGSTIDLILSGKPPDVIGQVLPAEIQWTESVKDWNKA